MLWILAETTTKEIMENYEYYEILFKESENIWLLKLQQLVSTVLKSLELLLKHKKLQHNSVAKLNSWSYMSFLETQNIIFFQHCNIMPAGSSQYA